MKVLREAEIWKKEVECTGNGYGGYGCGTLLEVDENDIYINKVYDLEGDYENRFTIKCPCCKIPTRLSRGEIPDRIVNKVIQKDRKDDFDKLIRKRLFYED